MEYRNNILKTLLILVTFVSFAKGKEIGIAEIETANKSNKLLLLVGGTGAAATGMVVGAIGGKLYFSKEQQIKDLEEKVRDAKLQCNDLLDEKEALEKEKDNKILEYNGIVKEKNTLLTQFNELKAAKEKLEDKLKAEFSNHAADKNSWDNEVGNANKEISNLAKMISVLNKKIEENDKEKDKIKPNNRSLRPLPPKNYSEKNNKHKRSNSK